ALYAFSREENSTERVFTGKDLTSFEIFETGDKVVVGTKDGYLELDGASYEQLGEINSSLPWPAITVLKEVNGNLWFGSERGAFMLKEDGGFNYYYGERWLPGENVVDITQGED